MVAYAARRVLLALVILLVVMAAMFLIVFIIPGDAASIALGPRATPELKALLVARMGLDQPWFVQLWRFVSGALTGDLGLDVWSRRPVLDMILEVLPRTLALGLAAMGWAVALGTALGVLAVVRAGSLLDRALGVLSVGVIAVPSFVVALWSLAVFAVHLGWFPAVGAGEAGDWGSQARALVLPAFAVGLGWVGYVARLVRASLLEVMGMGHVRTARAFGLAEPRVVLRYGLRVAVVPVIAILAVGLGGILSAAVFVEAVFSRPGIGTLVTEAVQSRNFPVVMGAVLVMTAFYLAVVTAADLLIALLDPRVRDVLRG